MANKFDSFLIQCLVHYGGNPFLEKNLDNFIVIDSKLLNQLLALKFVLANFKYVNTYGCCCFNCFCTHGSMVSIIHLVAILVNWWCSWNVNVQVCKDNIERLFVTCNHFSLHTLRGIVGLLAPIFFYHLKIETKEKTFQNHCHGKEKTPNSFHQKLLSTNLRWGSFCKSFGRHNHGSCNYCGIIYTCSS